MLAQTTFVMNRSDHNILRNLAIDSSDLNVQDTVSKLLLLAKIQPGEKLYVGDMSLKKDTYAEKLWRTYNRNVEDRNKSLDLIKSVTDGALTIALRCFTSRSSFDRHLGRMILESLEEAKKGITNLGQTYGSDKMFISRIEAFQRILDAKIKGITSETPRMSETDNRLVDENM